MDSGDGFDSMLQALQDARDELAGLRSAHSKLKRILHRAHGALADCSDIPVPGAYDEEIAPAIETLRRQRDEARAKAAGWTLTKDRVPEFGTWCLVVFLTEDCKNIDEAQLAHYSDWEHAPSVPPGWFDRHGYELAKTPYAWMPVPHAPGPEAADGD